MIYVYEETFMEYSICHEPWLIYVYDGSNSNCVLWVLNYRREGKYRDVGGGQDRRVNAHWKMEIQTLILGLWMFGFI